MDSDKILSRLVQIGVVNAIDEKKHMARVKFADTSIVSGWLYVLQHSGMGITVTPDGEHTHEIHDTYRGGGSASTIPDHNHEKSSTTIWMPKVGARVVVLYLPVADGDGFVLGGM